MIFGPYQQTCSANHRQSPRDRNGSCGPFIQKYRMGSQLFGECDHLRLSPIEEGQQCRWHRRDGADGNPGGLTDGLRSCGCFCE